MKQVEHTVMYYTHKFLLSLIFGDNHEDIKEEEYYIIRNYIAAELAIHGYENILSYVPEVLHSSIKSAFGNNLNYEVKPVISPEYELIKEQYFLRNIVLKNE